MITALFQQGFLRNVSGDVENPVRNYRSELRSISPVHMMATHGTFMPKRRNLENQNLLFFPELETPIDPKAGAGTFVSSAVEGLPHHNTISEQSTVLPTQVCDVVISGSYRKDFEALKRTYEEFQDLGCQILSPSSVTIVSEEDGFVYMKGEEREMPDKIEDRHLRAIQKANFVWLHSPNGYIGPTSALEIGFAHAAGVPVFGMESPKEGVFRAFVQVVASPGDVLKTRLHLSAPPAPALKAFQEYYRRAAVQRGYSREGPKECLLLMVEEVGELARALRKRDKLVRHGSYHDTNESQELADVFLYIVHMANVLDIDLADVVRDKETLNVKKFLASMG